MSPLVSVVVPCRDDALYLAQALDSVEAQTHREIEVLVIDDGSREVHSVALFDAWTRADVRLIRTPASGVSAARNRGIAEARGAYVLPLDADDRIAPDYIARAVAVLEARPDVGLVECEAAFFGERAGPWPRPLFRMPHFLLGNTIAPAALFRKSDFERTRGYDPAMLHGWEDFDLWLCFVELGLGVVRLPETFFFYRQRAASRSVRLESERHLAWAYRRILFNHKGLYARHARILPRYAARLARAAWNDWTVASSASPSARP